MHDNFSLLPHLEALFQLVVRGVTTGRVEPWGELGRNPKGDQVKWFDLAADKIVRTYLTEKFPFPVLLLSEEGEPHNFGKGEPEYIMILDPVDGSENFSRGLAHSGMAIALIPADQPISIQTVQIALVGNLFTENIWTAIRGQGAYCNGEPIRTSSVTQLEPALLSCDINRALIEPALAQILAQVRGIRSMGAASLELIGVADGTFDAHLDIRGILTPENFLASALVITEAGGMITDAKGESLPPIPSLIEGYSLIAAANPKLHAQLVHKLNVER